MTPFGRRARSRRRSLLEGLKSAVGFEYFDRLDHGRGRPSSCPRDQEIDRRLRPRHGGLHRPVSAVAHPAADAESQGLRSHRPAIANTLHQASDFKSSNGFGHGQSRRLSGISVAESNASGNSRWSAPRVRRDSRNAAVYGIKGGRLGHQCSSSAPALRDLAGEGFGKASQGPSCDRRCDETDAARRQTDADDIAASTTANDLEVAVRRCGRRCERAAFPPVRKCRCPGRPFLK